MRPRHVFALAALLTVAVISTVEVFFVVAK